MLESMSGSSALAAIAFVVPHKAAASGCGADAGGKTLQHMSECDEIYFIDRLPRLPINGKVDRKTLLAHLSAVRSASTTGADIVNVTKLLGK